MKITVSNGFHVRYHDEILKLVEFGIGDAAGSDLEVHVKKSSEKRASGCAYYDVHQHPGSMIRVEPGVKYLITIRLGSHKNSPDAPARFTHQHRELTEKHAYEICGWREDLVAVAAHEGQHIRQYRGGTPHSEVETEMVARAALARYRQAQGGESIYDLAWCSPSSPFTADELSARVERYSDLIISPLDCERMADAFWERIHSAPSSHVRTIRLG